MVANTFEVIDMIAQRALPLFKNSNAFLRQIDRQYSGQFARGGAKIGDTFRIRLPVDYVVQDGPVITGGQNTVETERTLTVTSQKVVPLEFTSADLTLSADDFEERYIKPAVNVLAGQVALDIMTMVDQVPNLVWKDDSGMVTPDARTFLLGGATMSRQSVPTADRKLIISPDTQANTVDSLKGLFNPNNKIGQQYSTGQMMGEALGFDWMMDQTVITHTNGTFTAGTVNGADQTGTTLTVNAITGTLEAGDVITLEGVYEVNRVTKESTGKLRQFVVMADVASGGTSITLYPPITPPSGGDKVPNQTVTASPANGADITLVGGASAQFYKNLAFVKNAFTLAMVDLTEDLPGAEVAVRRDSECSFRVSRQTDPYSNNVITRLECLYGFALPRPEWACIVADPIA